MSNLTNIESTELNLTRKIVVVGFVFSCFKDQWYVLANQRSENVPDYKKLWNCPSGFLKVNETIQEACCRKIYEETGIIMPNGIIYFDDYDDSPMSDDQTIIFKFNYFDKEGVLLDQTFRDIYADDNKVSNIKWIMIDNIRDYLWAFDHREEIEELIELYIF